MERLWGRDSLASCLQWKVVYLATGPGLLGHTGFNFLLSWLTPLVSIP